MYQRSRERKQALQSKGKHHSRLPYGHGWRGERLSSESVALCWKHFAGSPERHTGTRAADPDGYSAATAGPAGSDANGRDRATASSAPAAGPSD